MDEEFFKTRLRKAKAHVIVEEHKYVEWLMKCGMDFRTALRHVRSQISADELRIELKLREGRNEEESNHGT